eukprot:superscaffoldBa00001092_g8920
MIFSTVAFDEEKQLCCGPNETVLTRKSPDEQCCGHEVYNTKTECCYEADDVLKKASICSQWCSKKSAPSLRHTSVGHHVTIRMNSAAVRETKQSPIGAVQSVCCSSEDNEVLYSIKTGFRCCGHLYYNSTLWSCFAGKLSPVSQLCAESRLLSLNNLNETDLCKEMYIGTVESVSLVTVVFRNVLKIHGRNGTVKPLALPHFLKIPDHYNSTKLIPGKTYFFHDSTKLIPGKTYVFHDAWPDVLQEQHPNTDQQSYMPTSSGKRG